MLSLFLSCSSANKIKRNCYFRVCVVAFRNTFDEFVIFPRFRQSGISDRSGFSFQSFFSTEITDRTFLYFSFKSKRMTFSRSKERKKFFDRKFARKNRVNWTLCLTMNRYYTKCRFFFVNKLRVYKEKIRCCFSNRFLNDK